MSIYSSKSGFSIPVIIAGLLVLGMAPLLSAKEKQKVLFDFVGAEAQSWRATNDGVMGGLSKGSSEITKDGSLQFAGILSLENRGGFSSVRSGQVDLSGAKEIILRVRGDGRSYYCSLRQPTNRMAYSYRAAFDTKSDKWKTIRIPLKDFQASWFGRTLKSDGPIDPKNVQSIGITLADKKEGPFRLEIDWIKIK